jgi:hypothetical protein
MSWGIEFSADIYLIREDFKSKAEVEDKIKELEQLLIANREELKMFASANPSDIIPIDWKEEPIRWISERITDLLNEIAELTIKVYQLNLYLEVLNNIKD